MSSYSQFKLKTIKVPIPKLRAMVTNFEKDIFYSLRTLFYLLLQKSQLTDIEEG